MVASSDFLKGRGPGQVPAFQGSDEGMGNPEGELHLRFYVPSGTEFALHAVGIKEVISLAPDRITPIPNVSPLLLGTLNLRGQVIWVADLGQFLGDATVLNTDRNEIPVVAVQDQDIILGLAVDQIVGMHWLDLDELQIATNVPDNILPFLRGEWVLNAETGEHLRLLDQAAIIRSARWAA